MSSWTEFSGRPAHAIDNGIRAVHRVRRKAAEPDTGRRKRGDAMRIQVSGKQIDIGEALRQHVEGRMGEAVV